MLELELEKFSKYIGKGTGFRMANVISRVFSAGIEGYTAKEIAKISIILL